ncbi:helix-turn-helix domain-containing protein [Streptomyces sp. NBC_00868]|uniref:helix-turn-helix domain-containing protein n=2 Tax=Streptomyces TaxID=1883 RepID=UPI00324AA859|nr:helix-turn-helix domain-containing protein [Streptomyces sp. NBC_00868]
MRLNEATGAVLQQLASSAKAQVRQVLRARIVLAAADGDSNGSIARQLAVSVNTVRQWRGRYAQHGLEGLKDAARTGRPRRYGDLVRVAVVAAATSMPPGPQATWLNQVELVFSALTRAVLRHGDFSSREDLIEKIDAWAIRRNEHARLFRWTYDGSPLKEAS